MSWGESLTLYAIGNLGDDGASLCPACSGGHRTTHGDISPWYWIIKRKNLTGVKYTMHVCPNSDSGLSAKRKIWVRRRKMGFLGGKESLIKDKSRGLVNGGFG